MSVIPAMIYRQAKFYASECGDYNKTCTWAAASPIKPQKPRAAARFDLATKTKKADLEEVIDSINAKKTWPAGQIVSTTNKWI